MKFNYNLLYKILILKLIISSLLKNGKYQRNNITVILLVRWID